MPLLKDETPEVRRSVIADLSKLRDRRAVGPVIDALKDNVFEVRLAAIVALGVLGNDRAAEPLIGFLPDQRLGAVAAEALANTGSASAIEPLINALALMTAQGRPADADRTVASLRRLTGQNLGADAAGWRKWRESARQR